MPEKEIPAKRPFLISVKNADGSPAKGMGVRLDGHLPVYTDEKGTAIGWTTGHIGRLTVHAGQNANLPVRSFGPFGEDIVAQKKDIDIPEGEEMPKVELTIPAPKPPPGS